MKIKLICPSFYDLNDNLFKPKFALMPPLSIFYLAGFIPQNHTVTAVDETIEEINFDEKVDLVAITATTFSIRRAYQIADEYKKRGTKVVMGGIHVTFLTEEALQHADTVVIGEAEDSWPRLLSDFEKGKLEKIYQTPPRTDLSNLPQPRFDLINNQFYFKPPGSKYPITPIFTSRGCPHNCSFCSVTKFWGKKLRFRPISEIIEEIKNNKSKTIFFTDDNFIANPKRAIELCIELKRLKIKFFCQIDSIISNREEVIKYLGEAGCYLVFIGFERIDQTNLANLNKKFNLPNEYKRLIKELHKNSISVYASLIFGLEGDNHDVVNRTVDFLIKTRVELASFFALTALPGTDLYEDLKSKGQVKNLTWWLNPCEKGKEGLFNYTEKTVNEYELCSLAMKNFYSNASMVKRFILFRLYKTIPLALNFGVREKMKKVKYGYVM